MKNLFIRKIHEYPNLKKYSDILYQILRKSELSQFLAHNQPMKQSTSNSRIIQAVPGQSVARTNQQTQQIYQYSHIPGSNIQSRAGPSLTFQPSSSSSSQQPCNTYILGCPFENRVCTKRVHNGLPAIIEHLNMDHFQTMLMVKITEEQKQTR